MIVHTMSDELIYTKIGLCGSGHMGRIYANNIQKYAVLFAIIDTDEYGIDLADEYNCKYVNTIESIIDELDAIVLTTPIETHCHYIKVAIDHDKPVLCEASIADSIRDATICKQFCNAIDGLVMMGFHRRFDNMFNRVRMGLHANINDIELVEIMNVEPKPPDSYVNSSNDIVIDMCINDLDMTHWLLCEQYFISKETIRSSDGNQVDIKLIGNSGIVYKIHADRCGIMYDQIIKITFKNKTTVTTTNPCETNDLSTTYFENRYAAAYDLEMSVFIDLVNCNYFKQYPNIEDGYNAICLAISIDYTSE
jgi:hypothetical protein